MNVLVVELVLLLKTKTRMTSFVNFRIVFDVIIKEYYFASLLFITID